MNELHIIEDYGTLSVNSYVRFALSEYKGKSSFELRYWWDGHPQKNCIKFSKNSLEQLYIILKTAINTPKSDSPIRTEIICGSTVHILNKFGSFCSYNSTYDVTYTQWDGRNKYDIRYWDGSISELPKGIRLTEEECFNFVRLLDKEFEKENEFDKNINLSFLSYETINNLCFGEGYCFKFLLENNDKSSYEIEIKDIHVNNFKIADYGLTYRINGHENIVIEIYTYPSRDKLHNYQIHSIIDIKRIAFSIETRCKNTNKKHISKQDILIHP